MAAARAAEDALGQADDRLESVLTARTVLADATAALDTALASISSDLVDAERLRAAVRAGDPLWRSVEVVSQTGSTNADLADGTDTSGLLDAAAYAAEIG